MAGKVQSRELVQKGTGCMLFFSRNLFLQRNSRRRHVCVLCNIRSKAVVLLLLTFCLLLLPLWESVIVLCFIVRCFMSILVLQSSWWGRESWLLCLICLPGVSWWLSGSSSRWHGVVCGLWVWYFLIILSYYFWCLKMFNSFIIHVMLVWHTLKTVKFL